MRYVEVMKSVGVSLSKIKWILHETEQHTEENKETVLNLLKMKLQQRRQNIRYDQEAERLMAGAIQSMDGMSCLADMVRVEEMIKNLYARLMKNHYISRRKEG